MTYNVSITSFATNTSHVFSETNFTYHVINFVKLMIVFCVTYCMSVVTAISEIEQYYNYNHLDMRPWYIFDGRIL